MTSPMLTPRETVAELDRYIISQDKAKRAVAIALRNRWRRQSVPEELRDEIAPKNIILIGPTGVGKTEIARRLAKLGQAPFIKVEASKFTEVGYVGRDVESMVRDLVEIGIAMIKGEALAKAEESAKAAAEARVFDLLWAKEKDKQPKSEARRQGTKPPADLGEPRLFAVSPTGETVLDTKAPVLLDAKAVLKNRLHAGELDDETVEIDAAEKHDMPAIEICAGSGLDEVLQNFKSSFGATLGSIGTMGFGQKEAERAKREVTVEQAIRIFTAEESEKLVDMEKVTETALERVQTAGIIFIDEIDKIALHQGRGGGNGPDVSRGGVQRDLLPLVEGSSVTTKYGVVKTDHILFIAAGAFHESKVSDLIPELQGRFPIRVELETLTEADFLRILVEPENSLTKQYTALLATENVNLTFSEDALAEIARVAYEANTRLENIGARRLHTVFEALLEEVSFQGPELAGQTVVIDGAEVKRRLGPVLADEDLSRYIL